MWNKPRSHSPISPSGQNTPIYKSPTLIKANFTPPTSPEPKSIKTQKTSNPQVHLRSKTPGNNTHLYTTFMAPLIELKVELNPELKVFFQHLDRLHVLRNVNDPKA